MRNPGRNIRGVGFFANHDSPHSLALKRDGAVVAWGYTSAATKVPEGLPRAISIAVGRATSFAIVREPYTLEIIQQNGEVALSWEAEEEGVEWHVETANSLSAGNWSSIDSAPANSGNVKTVNLNDIQENSRFFRLKK